MYKLQCTYRCSKFGQQQQCIEFSKSFDGERFILWYVSEYSGTYRNLGVNLKSMEALINFQMCERPHIKRLIYDSYLEI